MTSDEGRQQLQAVSEQYQKGMITMGGACNRLYQIAAFLEPQEVLASIPESIRVELVELGTRPLPGREDFFVLEGVVVRPGNAEQYRGAQPERENNQYKGLCRLHEYLNRPV
jgi:hypothetical protein